MSQIIETRWACPKCGTTWQKDSTFCFICKHLISDGNPISLPEVTHSFSLATLMLAVTVISVCLGVGTHEPGWGLGLAVVAGPAWVMAAESNTQRRQRGEIVTWKNRLYDFVASMAMVVVILIGGAVILLGTLLLISAMGIYRR